MMKSHAFQTFTMSHSGRLASRCFFALSVVIVSLALPSYAETTPEAGGVTDSVRQEIADILQLKDSFSDGEKKLSTNLAFASRRALGKTIGGAVDMGSCRDR